MTQIDHTRFMRLALSLGRRGQGRVWPNPAVGCVIVQGNRIVGRGWTADGGRPHAETIALAQAGAAARGAAAYVTLEPCAHHGQTPPCAQALIDAGVAHVICALTDKDARVNGQGFAMLEAAGIRVTHGICSDIATLDHAGFMLRTTQSRPFITLKLASSFDGKIATHTGDSQWITGPQARRSVHAMRMRHDAVMVGAGTLRADDPSLTVRDMGADRQPVRVVVGRAASLPQTAKLFTSASHVPTWVLHSDDAPKAALSDAFGDVKFLNYSGNIAQAMAVLADQGITRVFCEGGGTLAASLLQAGLVDQLVGHTGGVAIGGDGLSGLASLGVDTLAQAPRFKLVSLRALGNDVEHIWQRA